jgi:uncharacterized membrane protein YhhN
MISMLLPTTILSAICCIWFGYRQPRQLFYLFKPLTMLLIFLVANLGNADQTIYKLLIAAGLVFSLAGDVLLMLPLEQFRAGLTAFLLAHLFYISAFLSLIDSLHWWPPVILLIIGTCFILYIFPKLGSQKIPVILYIGVILVMVWTAGEVLYQDPQIGTWFVFVGAILFVVSDLILALNRFQNMFNSARALNLTAYFTAQLLIASSVGLLVL